MSNATERKQTAAAVCVIESLVISYYRNKTLTRVHDGGQIARARATAATAAVAAVAAALAMLETRARIQAATAAWRAFTTRRARARVRAMFHCLGPNCVKQVAAAATTTAAAATAAATATDSRVYLRERRARSRLRDATNWHDVSERARARVKQVHELNARQCALTSSCARASARAQCRRRMTTSRNLRAHSFCPSSY